MNGFSHSFEYFIPTGDGKVHKGILVFKKYTGFPNDYCVWIGTDEEGKEVRIVGNFKDWEAMIPAEKSSIGVGKFYAALHGHNMGYYDVAKLYYGFVFTPVGENYNLYNGFTLVYKGIYLRVEYLCFEIRYKQKYLM